MCLEKIDLRFSKLRFLDIKFVIFVYLLLLSTHRVCQTNDGGGGIPVATERLNIKLKISHIGPPSVIFSCVNFDRKNLVHDVTTALWCSNRGMSESELVEMLDVS